MFPSFPRLEKTRLCRVHISLALNRVLVVVADPADMHQERTKAADFDGEEGLEIDSKGGAFIIERQWRSLHRQEAEERKGWSCWRLLGSGAVKGEDE